MQKNATKGIMDELIRLMYSYMSGNPDRFSLFYCLFAHPLIQEHFNLQKTHPTLHLFIQGIFQVIR